MKEKAYEAFWWLLENHRWAIHSMDIHMARVRPDTRVQDDDMSKNTLIEYWIEGGPMHESGYSHDIRLDCGGETFEEALIEYAALVKKYYSVDQDKE